MVYSFPSLNLRFKCYFRSSTFRLSWISEVVTSRKQVTSLPFVARFMAEFFFMRRRNGRREMTREMSKYYHVSLPPGTSCPHCNKICRSIIGLWSHPRIHMTDVWKTQFSFRWNADDDYMFSVKCLFHHLHTIVSLYIYVLRSSSVLHVAHANVIVLIGGLMQFCIWYHDIIMVSESKRFFFLNLFHYETEAYEDIFVFCDDAFMNLLFFVW